MFEDGGGRYDDRRMRHFRTMDERFAQVIERLIKIFHSPIP
jgi:hypothetical protein